MRPALILAQTNIDLTVAFVTTQLQWQEVTDIVLQPSPSNGIKKTSIVRLSKLATIDASLVIGKIGVITKLQINELNLKLKMVFQIQ